MPTHYEGRDRPSLSDLEFSVPDGPSDWREALDWLIGTGEQPEIGGEEVKIGMATPSGGLGGLGRLGSSAAAGGRAAAGATGRAAGGLRGSAFGRQLGIPQRGAQSGKLGGAAKSAAGKVANPKTAGGAFARNVAGGGLAYRLLTGDDADGGGGAAQSETPDLFADSGQPAAEAGPAAGTVGAGIGAGAGGLAAGGGAVADDPLDALSGEIERLEEEAAAVQDDYEAQKQELRDLFALSETPEERAQIEFMLEDLEARAGAASEAIASEYSAAREEIGARAAQMRDQAAVEGQQVAGQWQEGAEAARADRDAVQAEHADSGVGVGATSGDGRVESATEEMERRAVTEGDFARRSGEIAADDAAWLADTLAAEAPAHQGQLQRETAARQAEAQMAHQQQVNDRIATDRRQLAQLESQLTGQGARARQDLLGQAAGLAQQEAMAREDRQQSAADRQLQREAQGLAGGDGGAGGFEVPSDPQEQWSMFMGMEADGAFVQMQRLANTGLIDPRVLAEFDIEPGEKPNVGGPAQ